MRQNTFVQLAFNSKYITDFTYNSGASPMFLYAGNAGGNATFYNYVKEANRQAKNLGNALVRLKPVASAADHTTDIIDALDVKPVVMGHSTGGLLAQMLAGRGLSAATVAIDPGVFRGVLPLPGSVLKGVGPFLLNPLTRGRAITLTYDQFKYGWANALDEKEAKQLYDTFHVAGSGISLVQMGNANLNPWTEAKVDTKNPDRGPLLIIDGEKDHTVPWAIANAAYKRQRRNPGVTEIVKIPNRGHALTIDHGWREVAQTALDFVKRFA